MSSYIERPRTACSLGGALATISSLPGVVPISHTTAGCAGNLSIATAFNSGSCGSSYCSGQSVPVSNISERHVIFGGSDRLEEEIRNTLELIEADLFVVTTGCMTEIIADDVNGVVSQFKDADTPVIYINTPSFEADAYGGYEILFHEIYNKYLPVSEEKNSKLVNIFGVVPLFDPFFRGDLEEIKRLLNRIELQVNTFFTADETFNNIKSAPTAKLNIVLSRVRGVEVAKKFQEKHGTPYIITELPVGAEDTERFLLQVADEMNIDKRAVKKVIKAENEIYYRYVERITDLIADSEFKYYAEVVSNGNTAIPYARFLQKELGWLINDVVITDILNDKQKNVLLESFNKLKIGGNLIFETDTSKITKKIVQNHPNYRGEFYFNSEGPVYVLGSSLEKEFSIRRDSNTLSVSYPLYNRVILDRGYAGFRGGLHLIEDILNSLVAGR